MPDYYDAAQRHWDDASLLHDNLRLPNADQLFGLSAECSLKAVMLALGMPMLPSGKPKEKRHSHINILWDAFGLFANGRGQANYAAMLGTTNPFSSWDIGHRYEHANLVSPQDVLNHRAAADIAMTCMTLAIDNGDIL